MSKQNIDEDIKKLISSRSISWDIDKLILKENIEKLLICNPHNARHIMLELNQILKGFGIENVRSTHANDKYWGKTIALYVNLGDTYDLTIVYDIFQEIDGTSVHINSWGEWFEETENYGK